MEESKAGRVRPNEWYKLYETSEKILWIGEAPKWVHLTRSGFAGRLQAYPAEIISLTEEQASLYLAAHGIDISVDTAEWRRVQHAGE